MLRNKLIMVGALLLGIVLLGTSGYYLLGHLSHGAISWSLADCFYMTIITLTTVGYGEVIDIAVVPGGRMFTILILLGGLGVSAYFVSTLTAFLIGGELKNVYWRRCMKKGIDKLEQHIILCGAGRVGHYILSELMRTGKQLVLIENNEAKIMELQNTLGEFPAVAGDATMADVLNMAGVTRASGIISTLHDDKDNLCVVVTCKQLNPALKIISKCNGREFAGKLELLGAQVVIPSFIGGLRMASQMIRPHIVQYLDYMLRDKDHVVRIEEVLVAAGSSLVGQQVGELPLDKFGNLLLLAVMAENKPHPLHNPNRDYVIQAADTLVFQAERKALKLFCNKYGC